MNYYKVAAKCGHVGKRHFIIKDFYVKAEDGKEAARKARFFPRVKHDWRDAIISVELITKDEFIQGWELHNNDLFFQVSNTTEQRLYEAVDDEEVVALDEPEMKKKKDRGAMFYSKMARILQRELRVQLAEVV